MTPVSSHDLKGDRARFAYTEAAGWPEHWRKDATKRVQGLPVQIRTQGLLVTLAALTGETDEAGPRLAGALATWLLKEAPHRPLGRPATRDRPSAADLLDTLARAPRPAHAAAQREAILLLDQVKIFAKALHGQED